MVRATPSAPSGHSAADAVAIFNVRGTGNSGGCFSWLGPAEQRDQAFLVEWLAKRPWSNGRIGMMGLSYHGTTPWEVSQSRERSTTCQS